MNHFALYIIFIVITVVVFWSIILYNGCNQWNHRVDKCWSTALYYNPYSCKTCIRNITQLMENGAENLWFRLTLFSISHSDMLLGTAQFASPCFNLNKCCNTLPLHTLTIQTLIRSWSHFFYLGATEKKARETRRLVLHHYHSTGNPSPPGPSVHHP